MRVSLKKLYNEIGVIRLSQHTVDKLEIELSNRKESMLSNQLSRAIDASGIRQIGESRYEGKEAALADGASGSHEINQRIGITSYASMEKFQSNAHTFGAYCYERYGLNDIRSIKPEYVSTFLSELCDRDYARNTVQGYASTIEKLAVVLDAYSPAAEPRTESWHAAIDGVRDDINDCVQKDTVARAYADPQAIIDNLPSERLQLAGDMQLHYGLRIADATKIDARGIGDDNTYTFSSKGGQIVKIELSPEDAQRIRDVCGDSGLLGIKQSEYRSALQTACESTGQEWTGSHGLRHNYAQNRMHELVDSGVPHTRALVIVSEELGHHRAEITHTYLNG